MCEVADTPQIKQELRILSMHACKSSSSLDGEGLAANTDVQKHPTKGVGHDLPP